MYEWAEDAVPVGVRRIRALSKGSFGPDAFLVECGHDPGYRRVHGGGETDSCRVCRGERSRTDGFAWPVKMLARISDAPKRPTAVPESVELTLF